MVLISILLLGSLYSVQAAPVENSAPYKLHIKLHDTTRAEPHGQTFRGVDSPSLNSKLTTLRAKVTRPLFRDNRLQLKSRVQSLQQQGHTLGDLSQYFELSLPASSNPAAAVAELKKVPHIAEAYIAPHAVQPPSPLFVTQQSYRNNAPTGLSANVNSSWPGAQGDAVTVADLEYSWNRNHEDLAKARVAGSTISYATPTDPFNNDNHGTMVSGVLSGTNNAFGVTGIVPHAQFKMAPVNYQEYGYDLATTLYSTANALQPGDVMLIEQQTYLNEANYGTWMPVEWYPAFYDAIRYATARGIIVVEPAGNGYQDLNTYGSPFPSGKADSGAIMVGAATACGQSAPRQRLSYSNYGTRVNLQSWGECVTTTGWYDEASALWYDGVNAAYTKGFAGTSSASAIVAGAAAAFSSAYEKLNGVAPSPSLVRSTLIAQSTPQNTSTPGHIGPQPDLTKALPLTDLKNPTAPTSLTVSLNTSRKPVLKWRAAADNVGIQEYRIYRGSTLIKTIPASSLTFTDTTALTGKTYQYKIQARDRAGRLSAYSNTVTITVR